ncbi:NAD+ synthase (glutamine-hydrolyzing) [Actinoalloteichus hoggarensis]|uniref:Glutamine-dependent NAD(+) synthetase n=1 Tax=Actinoalloteichus hoggarensis TaxID=1470176 RepID=A0A221W899_9PSEU|nr:NAD+ synthase [Actinoalloteichus hoggarensis]ASO22230.1 Glutamine-dependent NAD(+) synthetase [Actinoalloteichus hoggarensis]MBB5923348.1 NAD+ synthase (glutamine-hydrolyzing) [Actinoalloteichus hoggarensis]
MAQLRMALAQVNATVGDLRGNSSKIVDRARQAVEAGAQVVVFPEMVLTGYPIEDLALRRSFATAARAEIDVVAERLASAGCGAALVVIGYLDHDEKGPRNAAALVHDGRVVERYAKQHLPNYGVFDEFRYFVPGGRLPIVRFGGVDVGVVICEDIWREEGPTSELAAAGVDLVLCLNGSPYERAKDDTRGELVARRARELGAPMAYVNLVGAQDELVFDGDSMIVDGDGVQLARSPQFVEDLLVVDLDLPPRDAARSAGRGAVGTSEIARTTLSEAVPPMAADAPEARPVAPPPLSEEAEVWAALVTGLRDYVAKNGFRTVSLGLSGGIDSAVVAALCVDAVGADRVHGVSMPSSYSSEHSKSDAADLAERTGLHYRVEPIVDMVRVFVDQLGLSGLAEENVQARCRAVTLMGLSNQEGHLVLATGNKTELAVGYSTIYGDAVGGFAPIKDVPKTFVWRLAEWRNAEARRRGETLPIPPNSITKPPSAELRPDQMDSDSLPDYPMLDAVLDAYVEGDQGYADLVAAGFDAALVERIVRMVDAAEYKRRQYPPGTKITLRAFGRDRRLPITNRWREHKPTPEQERA